MNGSNGANSATNATNATNANSATNATNANSATRPTGSFGPIGHHAVETSALGLERGMFRMHDVSATIPLGQMTAIVGPNGSGKSTLLHVIAGLIAKHDGEVLVRGRSAAHYSRSAFARTVAMLPQMTEALPELTVRELVAFGRTPHQKPLWHRLSEEDERIVDWALKAMRIRRHEDRMFHTLSGGEQQKARIAMALAQHTDIVLLDEPTSFLDIAHQLEVMGTLARLNRERGTTFVMVLHDLQQAAAFCGHLIVMRDGELVAAGPPRSVVTRRLLREVYDIEATVSFEGAYPVIIPILNDCEEEDTVIIVTNTSQITKGNGDKLVERFDRIGKVETMEGFLGLEVMLTQNVSEYDEVSVVTRWRSKEDFQNWTKSEAFRESHSSRIKPDYIISNKITFQEVKIRRDPIAPVPAELRAQGM